MADIPADRKVRDYAWRVTCDLEGVVEVDFGDVWSMAADGQGGQGDHIVMQLVGQKMITVGQKCLRSRMVDDGGTG